jgi:twitching motility two-component system response regulator PilG
MQTNIDLQSILAKLSISHSTGFLEVTNNNMKWIVSIQYGQLLTADCSVHSLPQLSYSLRRQGCDIAAKAVSFTVKNTDSSADKNILRKEIDRLVKQGILDPMKASQVALEVTKEALESLLWLKTGSYRWYDTRSISPTTIKTSESRLDLPKLMEYYQQRLAIWQRYITIIQSPHQRPYLIHHRLSEKSVAAGSLSPKALNQIAQLMRGMSLRELALFLKQDELKIIQLLIPYIRENVICLREPPAPFSYLPNIPEPDLLPIPWRETQIDRTQNLSSSIGQNNTNDTSNTTKKYKVACIDDSLSMLDKMEHFFGRDSKYALTKIANPIKASALIFRLKPDLILMDITMPDINGYKLCQLLRSSATFAKTPIIMVTGNKGLIDKARAKMVGATDYLTKPFTQQELLGLADKYLI